MQECARECKSVTRGIAAKWLGTKRRETQSDSPSPLWPIYTAQPRHIYRFSLTPSQDCLYIMTRKRLRVITYTIYTTNYLVCFILTGGGRITYAIYTSKYVYMFSLRGGAFSSLTPYTAICACDSLLGGRVFLTYTKSLLCRLTLRRRPFTSPRSL